MYNENESYEFDAKETVKAIYLHATNGGACIPGKELKHFEVDYDDEDVLVNKKNVDVKISTVSIPKDLELKTAMETAVANLTHLEVEFVNGITMKLEIPEHSDIHIRTKEKEDEMRFVFSIHHEPDFDEEDEEEDFDEDDFDSDEDEEEDE